MISIPIWLLALLVLISIWAVLDRILIPSTRWVLRRRVNRVIDEISSRLQIEIRPFQLTKRQVLIDRLVYDPKVVEAVQAEAQATQMPREALMAEVNTYAKEIVPSFNAYLYFRIGYWLSQKIVRLLYWVRIGTADNQQYAHIDPEATVVFVMNHRSNMDYIIVSFLVAERTALSYAVGEWAKIWPLQTLIRAMGAFFVRRNSKNKLYRLVLERYVHMATREGVCQAVFPEGGLSRDGRLRPPKLGIINYMVRSFDPERDRDIVFIPVGINYDRTVEDRSLIRSLDPLAERRSRWYVVKTSIRFMLRGIWLTIQSRWQRFGFACVNFGPSLSIREYCSEQGVCFNSMDDNVRFKQVEALSRVLMQRIRNIIPVLPVPLVSAVFVDNPQKEMSAFEVEERVNRLIEKIESRGARIFVSSRSRVQNIVTALNMLKIRHLVKEADGIYRADPDSFDILKYYANSITKGIVTL